MGVGGEGGGGGLVVVGAGGQHGKHHSLTFPSGGDYACISLGGNHVRVSR